MDCFLFETAAEFVDTRLLAGGLAGKAAKAWRSVRNVLPSTWRTCARFPHEEFSGIRSTDQEA
jgi:hypothetical protein